MGRKLVHDWKHRKDGYSTLRHVSFARGVPGYYSIAFNREPFDTAMSMATARRRIAQHKARLADTQPPNRKI